MKWFKHDSSASMDAKIENLMIRYGLEGYGLYFYCLELVARNVEKHNLTFELEHDAKIIARRLYQSEEKIQEMMMYMVNLGLFEASTGGVITCLKMATRTDEYTQKLIHKSGSAHLLSRQCPDTNGRKSELIEENRIEENRLDVIKADSVMFDEFWELYPRKEKKKGAETTFNRLSQKKQRLAIADIKSGRFESTERRFIPLPTSYLNAERWNDEQPTTHQLDPVLALSV